jgi:hypothetical protein
MDASTPDIELTEARVAPKESKIVPTAKFGKAHAGRLVSSSESKVDVGAKSEGPVSDQDPVAAVLKIGLLKGFYIALILLPLFSFFILSSPTIPPYIFPAAMLTVIIFISMGEIMIMREKDIVRTLVPLMTCTMMLVLMLVSLAFAGKIKASEMDDDWKPFSFAISAVLLVYAVCFVLTSPFVEAFQKIPEVVKKLMRILLMVTATILFILIMIQYVGAKFLTTNG